MVNSDPEKYQQFRLRSKIDTFFIEMQIRRRLVGVSVMDHVTNGLSAVYTFFEPGEARRGLSILSILQQVELTRQIEYEWLYLGYWIENCQKMHYKVNFTPLQTFNVKENN
jgi:arginine-tRNA-protein transferase